MAYRAHNMENSHHTVVFGFQDTNASLTFRHKQWIPFLLEKAEELMAFQTVLQTPYWGRGMNALHYLTVSWWICVILEITKYMCACLDLDFEHSLIHERFMVMQLRQHKVSVFHCCGWFVEEICCSTECYWW